MAILMVSANPLFVEAITETLSPRLVPELVSSAPEAALKWIQEKKPEVILVDDDIPPGMLKKILHQAQRVSKTRLILLSCLDNDFLVIDSYQSTIGTVGDLVKFIEIGKLKNGDPLAGGE